MFTVYHTYTRLHRRMNDIVGYYAEEMRKLLVSYCDFSLLLVL